jgi:glycosyltransferase involved in cell wall biosynthesis
VATWQIITGEYPPQSGGVSDYSRLIAGGLAASGDEVDVWAPGHHRAELRDAGATIHRFPDHFGPRGLATLSHELKPHGRLLVQYVPHAFGAKAMNLAFAAWLFSRRSRIPIDVMFHEVAFPIMRRQPLRHNVLGLVNRIMAQMVGRSADRIFVAIPDWERRLRPLVRHSQPIICMPVPSNIPVMNENAASVSIRTRYCPIRDGVLIGHFGTYGEWIAEALKGALVPVLAQHSNASLLLIGSNSETLRSRLVDAHPSLQARVHAAGELNPSEVSRHITATDLMVQPYPDGISGRRTSAMAVLSQGRAMVTTSGDLTESVWSEKAAVAMVQAGDTRKLSHTVEHLIRDEVCRQRLGIAGRRLYWERFDLKHTIAMLRTFECESR